MIDYPKLISNLEGGSEARETGLNFVETDLSIRNRVEAIRWDLDAVTARLDAGTPTVGLTDALKGVESLFRALIDRDVNIRRLAKFGVNVGDLQVDGA